MAASKCQRAELGNAVNAAASSACRSPTASFTLRLRSSPACRHTVCYDDGEVGMHRLWQHDERIRLASPVEQWPREAALARHRLMVAQEKLRGRDHERRVAVSAGCRAVGSSVCLCQLSIVAVFLGPAAPALAVAAPC